MPKLQRFEGTDPAEVRARIREELGPDATIVRAGRERSGGMLGFFEREVFVIEVETADDAAPVERPAAQRGAAQRGAAPRAAAQRASAARGPSPATPGANPAATGTTASRTAAAAPATAAAAAANLALATAVATGGLDSAVEATADVVSIRGEQFDDSFSYVLKEAEATLAAGQEEEPGRFTPRLVNPAAAIDDATAPALAEPALDSPKPAAAPRLFGRSTRPGSPTRSLAPEYERVLRQAGIYLEVASDPLDSEVEHRPFPEVRAGFASYAPAAPAPAAAGAVAPAEVARVAVANVPAPRDEGAEADTLARIRLSRLGLPAGYQPDATVEPLEAALLASLAHVPTTPPLPEHEDAVLLALGGEGTSARLALLLAERIGAGEEAVVTVSAPGVALKSQPQGGRRVTSALRAATAVAERRIAGEPTVLAYELAEGAATAALLADVVAATRPDTTWAAVPANLEPLALRQIDRVARGIAALALYDLDDADRPAYLLGIGTPIALLDWRDATPLMWAARLAERTVGAR